MENQQSLADQLGWCITTQDYLNDLNQELKYVAQQYQESVNQLKSFGYFKEKMPHLENLVVSLRLGLMEWWDMWRVNILSMCMGEV
ncbi:MAG: hypothetical protein Q9M36_08470 [Sulfurovum sp.]|nr:hypothetical protein [Sulfurovum sp.]